VPDNPHESAGPDEELEDLPGLEPDEPGPTDTAPAEQPDPTPQTEGVPSAAAPPPERYGAGQWTNAELDDWYENEYGGEDQLNRDWRAGRLPSDVGRDLGDEYEWIEEQETGLASELDADADLQDVLLSKAFLSDDFTATFADLSPGMKAWLRTRIGQRRAGDTPAVLHTMPGDAGEMLTSPEVGAGFDRFKVIVIGGVATVASAAILFFSLGGGDDDSPDGSGAPPGATEAIAGAGATGSSDGGSSSSIPEPPVVIQPCDVIDTALAASLAGTATEAIRRGDDRTKSCDYRQPDGGEAIRLVMHVTRNSASGIMRTFRNNNDEPTNVKTVSWSEDGEVRAKVNGTAYSTVDLLAFVITSDPLGRDVYVTLSMSGPADASASMTTAAEQIAELLRDAILEAQP